MMKKVQLAFLSVALVALVGWFGLAYAGPDQPAPAQSDTPPAVAGISAWMNLPCQEGCGGCDHCNHPAWGEGGNVDFTALQGKVVVVEFWAAWCPPCRRSVPHLNELWEKHKANGLQVIAITRLDQRQTEEQARAFATENIHYPVAITSEMATYTNYGIRGIPHAVVVGRDGKVKWTGNPLQPQFTTAVDEAMAAPR
jgi:thiol-disulfide isomerase/thioredoxin